MRALHVAVLGLGEAGSEIASDLAEAGCDVRGFDPADAGRAPTVPRSGSEVEAADGADVVLSVNAAAVALDVASRVCSVLRPAQVYADLNTSAPALKLAIDEAVRPSAALFADVALVDPVPGNGLRTSALVSGPGADRFAELLAPLGMPIDVIGAVPGEAAARKLLRSVFMKGLAAAMVEGLEAAQASGLEPWLRAEIVRALDTPSAPLVERLLSGTRLHAVRRREEMAAAAEHLRSLGIEPRVATAAREWLEELAAREAVSA
jgi:3-hydroxyisobutyrate dehydrogenase-like beta-hydroxyacid dehydrogenase